MNRLLSDALLITCAGTILALILIPFVLEAV